MKNYVIINEGNIVHKYKSEAIQQFGGQWSSEYSIHTEVPDNLDLDCIKLEDGVLVEDSDKKAEVQLQKQSQISLKFLNETDYKVIRHLGQKALGINTSMTEQEYLELEQQRQEARDKVLGE